MLPFAEERGLGVVVRGPLYKGLLTGKFDAAADFAAGDIRASWPEDPTFRRNLEVVERLRSLTGPGQSLGQLAIRFVLSHPAVTAAIPGAKDPSQAEDNAAASRRPIVSTEERRLIDEVAPGPPP